MLANDVDATMPVALLEARDFAYKWIPRLEKEYNTAEENIYGCRVFQYLTEREVIWAG